jgi:hypothetical protein
VFWLGWQSLNISFSIASTILHLYTGYKVIHIHQWQVIEIGVEKVKNIMVISCSTLSIRAAVIIMVVIASVLTSNDNYKNPDYWPVMTMLYYVVLEVIPMLVI